MTNAKNKIILKEMQIYASDLLDISFQLVKTYREAAKWSIYTVQNKTKISLPIPINCYNRVNKKEI